MSIPASASASGRDARATVPGANICIAVSGLPASGKSTCGKAVAKRLGLPLLDKDDYLERQFRARGIGDADWRRRLSRESDALFRRDAERHRAVILISHWRPSGYHAGSGTPVDWLAATWSRVVELFCDCPVDVAANRFVNRERHPGHLDRSRSYEEILQWLANYRHYLPLSLGPLETLDAEADGGIDALAR